MTQLVFKRYKRNKNYRRKSSVVRVLKGYIHFNRMMTESLGVDRVDLFVDEGGGKVLVKPGSDFKLTISTAGRATFSAGPFLREYGIDEGFYPAEQKKEGLIFSINHDDRAEHLIQIEE